MSIPLPGSKLKYTPLLLILLLAFTPVAHADFTVAYLERGESTGENGYGAGIRGGGACFVASTTARVTTVTFTVRVFSGNPAGTMFARVYKATGNPALNGADGDCSGNQLLGTSDSINLDQLTGSMQNFTFTFSGTQQATVRNGQVHIIAVFFDQSGGTVGTRTGTGTGVPPKDDQHYVFSPDDGTTWNTGQPGCDQAIPSNGVCEVYTLNGVSPEDVPPPPGPSPYGYNPPYFPCCTQVGPAALQGASLRAPNVDSLPFVYLFLIIFALTLGPYLIVGKRRKTRQYEIAL